MCDGFGMIISKDLKGYFTTPDNDGDTSHSEILRALGWKENDSEHIRHFVRVQCPNWTIKSFEFDERGSLPGWAEENKDEIVAIVKKALRRAAPAWAKYEKVTAPAWAEYEKVTDTAWAEYVKVTDTAWAEYVKVKDTAWAEYVKVKDAAWAEYVKVKDTAWAEYVKVTDTAWAEYVKVTDTAWAEYVKVKDTAWARFVSRLSKISGFVQ